MEREDLASNLNWQSIDDRSRVREKFTQLLPNTRAIDFDTVCAVNQITFITLVVSLARIAYNFNDYRRAVTFSVPHSTTRGHTAFSVRGNEMFNKKKKEGKQEHRKKKVAFSDARAERHKFNAEYFSSPCILYAFITLQALSRVSMENINPYSARLHARLSFIHLQLGEI